MSLANQEQSPAVVMQWTEHTTNYDLTEIGAERLALDLRAGGWTMYLQSSDCNHSDDYGIDTELMNQFEEWVQKAMRE